MKKTIMQESSLFFEENVKLTGVKEYGFSWKQFAEDKAPIPPEGIRFDIHFEGEVNGDDLKGCIKGVDYLTVRADGRLFLDLHAAITTEDGVLISVSETGINEDGNLRLSMNFHTNDTRYNWINQKHVWGIGTVDFESGHVFIKGYQN